MDNTSDIHCLHLLLKTNGRGQRPIAVTGFKGKAIVLECIKAGVQGYLNKNDDVHVLKDCIDTVLESSRYFSQYAKEIALKNLDSLNNGPKIVFNDREMDILSLMTMGFTSNEIAQRLGTTKKSIDSSREEMQIKTKTSNAVELAMFCVGNGVVARSKIKDSEKKLESLSSD